MNKIEFPEDSDSSDDDYVPVTSNEVLSEVESDGEPEEPLSDSENPNHKQSKRRKTKSRKRKAEVEGNCSKETKKDETPKQELTEEEKKKHADKLWDSFKKDTNFKGTKACDTKTPKEEKAEETDTKKIKVMEILEFAGEQMRVEKEISADSKQAKNLLQKSATTKPKGGLSSVLSQIGKKTKITTLEKSKMDWEQFKKQENIAEDLEKYNKGKNG